MTIKGAELVWAVSDSASDRPKPWHIAVPVGVPHPMVVRRGWSLCGVDMSVTEKPVNAQTRATRDKVCQRCERYYKQRGLGPLDSEATS